MAYYMRFFATGDAPVTLPSVEEALRANDSAYALTDLTGDPPSGALLTYAGEQYAQIELETPPDPEEIAELIEEIDDSGSPRKNREMVKRALAEAGMVVVIQVLSGGREWDATTARLDPLWDWLHANHQGLGQADGAGYYHGDKRVLRTE